jgi:hypothetical protein
MRPSRLILFAVLGLVLAVYPASAQHFSVGLGGGPFYSPYYFGSYWGPWGYPYVPPVYHNPEVRPSGGVPMISGAVTYVDEGDYRNYRDASHDYIGRVPIRDIPSDRW